MISEKLQKELFNLDSINDLQEVITFTKSLIEVKAKSQISEGSEVFVVQKTKKTLGIVEKVNVKKAIVSMNGSRYNVPLTMLEVA